MFDMDLNTDEDLVKLRAARTIQELRSVREWREQLLEHAGFEHEVALLLANEKDVDAHRAIKMHDHGCPQDLVLAILT